MSGMLSKALKEPHTVLELLFLCRASHLEFCITISGCFCLPKLQFPSPQLSKTLNDFLLPVPTSENCLLALSQEDPRAYFICSLLSQTMVCTPWYPITKNSHSISFVQPYRRRLKLVTVLPERMKAEFLVPFWWQIFKTLISSVLNSSIFVSVIFSWSNLFNFLTKWSNSPRFSNLNNYSLPLKSLPESANNNMEHTVKLEFQMNNEQ